MDEKDPTADIEEKQRLETQYLSLKWVFLNVFKKCWKITLENHMNEK